jgi:hypothetical protein
MNSFYKYDSTFGVTVVIDRPSLTEVLFDATGHPQSLGTGGLILPTQPSSPYQLPSTRGLCQTWSSTAWVMVAYSLPPRPYWMPKIRGTPSDGVAVLTLGSSTYYSLPSYPRICPKPKQPLALLGHHPAHLHRLQL